MLESLGLSYGANILYESALSQTDKTKVFTPGATSLNKPEMKASLDELLHYGLAEMTDEGIKVVPFEEAVGLLISRQQTELFERLVRLAELRSFSNQVKDRTIDPVSELEIVRGPNSVQERIAELCKRAKISVDTLAPGGKLSQDMIARSQASGVDMLERGIKLRGIYLTSAKKDHKTLKHFFWYAEQNSPVRTLQKLPIRMIIVDHRLAILPLNLFNAMDGIAIYRNSALVKALQELFEFTWSIAKPIGVSLSKMKGGLTENEVTAFQMISEGKNDNEIAKKLGVSNRTVRRWVDDAIKRMKVNSRVEAVYQLAKRNQI